MSKPTAAPKKRKTKPGGLAMREIKFYQKTTQLLIRKLPFSRFVVGDQFVIS